MTKDWHGDWSQRSQGLNHGWKPGEAGVVMCFFFFAGGWKNKFDSFEFLMLMDFNGLGGLIFD